MAKVKEGNTRLQVSIDTEVYEAFTKEVSERKKGPAVEQLLREEYGPTDISNLLERKSHYVILAFTDDLKFKGKVDPSHTDSVAWIDKQAAINFIKANQPEGETWFLSIAVK